MAIAPTAQLLAASQVLDIILISLGKTQLFAIKSLLVLLISAFAASYGRIKQMVQQNKTSGRGSSTDTAKHNMMISASAKAFAMPELLENILIYFDTSEIRQLLDMQCINTIFRDTIRTSKNLRRKMLLEDQVDERCTKPMINPLCLETTKRSGVLFPVLVKRRDFLHLPMQERDDYHCISCWVDAPLGENLTLEELPIVKGGFWRSMKICNDARSVRVHGPRCISNVLGPASTLGDLADMLVDTREDLESLRGVMKRT